jgi:hypothetical protein
MKRSCDITVHLFSFKQLDNYFDATFKLRFSIDGRYEDFPITGEPYLLPKDSKSSLKTKYFITEAFTPGKLVNQDLNDMCTFRVEIPCKYFMEDTFKENYEVVIKCELFMYGLKGMKVANEFPPNSEGFSNIACNELKVSKAWNGVHEYTELVFSNIINCTASLAIHGNFLDYSFDYRLLQLKDKGKITLNFLLSSRLSEFDV